MCIFDIVDTLLHEQDKYQQWRKNVFKNLKILSNKSSIKCDNTNKWCHLFVITWSDQFLVMTWKECRSSSFELMFYGFTNLLFPWNAIWAIHNVWIQSHIIIKQWKKKSEKKSHWDQMSVICKSLSYLACKISWLRHFSSSEMKKKF